MNQLTNEELHPSHVKLRKQHVLLPFKYNYAALAPYIGSRTMIVHHDNHHANYVKKLNEALEMYPAFRDCSALWLLLNLEKLPEQIRLEVHHNAGASR